MADTPTDTTPPTAGLWVIIKHPPWVPFGKRDEEYGTYLTQADAMQAFTLLANHWEPFCSYTLEHRAS